MRAGGPEKGFAMPESVPMSVVMSRFTDFLESELGQALLDTERAALNSRLARLVGYNCLQLSVQRGASLCPEDAFGQLIRMGYAPAADAAKKDSVWANYEELPVASDCVDVAILHHVLEFAEAPHQLLREATRTLTAGGYLIVAGFNPFSLWPTYRKFYQWRSGSNAAANAGGKPARRLQSIRQGRLADWLSLLNYEVLDEQCLFFRPPINSARWLQRLEIVERFGKAMRLPTGLAYLTLARKRTLTPAPVQLGWRGPLHASPAARVKLMPLSAAKAQPAARQSRSRSNAGDAAKLRRIK